MYVRAATWWTIFRIGLEERLVYRADFALGTLMRFLPIITQIFLWAAVFESVGSGRVAGYTYSNMVAYYLLTMMSRAFSSMPGLASGVAAQIRSGEIKKFLVQPVDLIGFMFLNRIAHKLTYYTVAFFPFALVFYLCRGFFAGWPPDVLTAQGWSSLDILLIYISTLLMGFLLGFFLEMCIGLIGFWFLEVTSLLFVYMLLNFFLSGHMFPLDMLPEWAATIVDLFPLKYLAYFPAAVLLGQLEPAEIIWGLKVEVCWLVTFMILSRLMYSYGVKQYSAYGG
ncbi:MAG: ABC-2 family transporter protein [Planctomycetota bacterium]|nr:ABC-2 family transporter protein [Planctomycetota bacterium]